MKRRKSPPKPRDRRSASVEKSLPVGSLANTPANLQTNPIQPEQHFRNLLSRHGRFSKATKAFFQPYYKSIPVFAQGPTAEADEARFERVFRAWPKWVLRLGAELWHVRYPTIKSDTFFQTFRVLNVILFRCPTSTDAIVTLFAKSNALDRIDVRVLPIFMASFHGHSFEHLEAGRKSLTPSSNDTQKAG
jgi:hypothetical protein